jgi:hypothetical protein
MVRIFDRKEMKKYHGRKRCERIGEEVGWIYLK